MFWVSKWESLQQWEALIGSPTVLRTYGSGAFLGGFRCYYTQERRPFPLESLLICHISGPSNLVFLHWPTGWNIRYWCHLHLDHSAIRGQCHNWCEKMVQLHNSVILALCLLCQNFDQESMLWLMYIKVYTALVLFVDLTMSPSSLNWTEHVCLCFPMKIQVMDFGTWERDNSSSHTVFVKINLCSFLSNTLSY